METGIVTGATALSITEEKMVNGKQQMEVMVAFPVERDVKSADCFKVWKFPEILAVVAVHYGNGSTFSTWNRFCRFTSSKGY